MISLIFFRNKRFLVELALIIGVFSFCTGEFAMMGLISSLSDAFQKPETSVAHLISAYAVGVVVGAPIMVFVGVYLKKRKLVLFLLGLYTCANAFSLLAPNYETLLLSRLLAGFPHAAYFGVAAMIAASMAPFNKRGKAVSRILLGVTAAILVGAPGATYIGQQCGWRSVFAAITIFSLMSLILLYRNAPEVEDDRRLDVREELAPFAQLQIWLALAIGAVGFCGMFGVYSYLAPIVLNVTKLEAHWIAPMLMLFGVGTMIGNFAGGWLYDRVKFAAVNFIMLFSFFALFAFPILSRTLPGVSFATVLLGCMVALAPALQMRLMDISKRGQSLVAASNHAALNLANALGPWLGGLAINAGWGWTSTGYVGAGMAFVGCLIYWVAQHLERRVV
ncbi:MULTISPECIES: MFS transporter [Pseudomonas]|uniref:MFS transporter n=1 Tax=Pseudomonas TaxID=286 RepID=UPI001A9F7558|nr:MFS transporter [Pseudomonas marginalis]MBO1537112.1 MFS transporter [Pseudomonas sp. OA65]WGT28024.1 MFS transporter [Pseudomonas marginalis]